MAIDANVSIDGKPRGRYDFPEKVPKKLSDLENDLFYVRKSIFFDVTRDTIENYPVVHQLSDTSGGTFNIRKYLIIRNFLTNYTTDATTPKKWRSKVI